MKTLCIRLLSIISISCLSIIAFSQAVDWIPMTGSPACRAIAKGINSPNLLVRTVGAPTNGSANGVSGYYDGYTWTLLQCPQGSRALNAMFSFSPSNIYACGAGGLVVHFDGVSWTDSLCPYTYNFIGAWGTQSTVYFLDSTNHLVTYVNGTWSVETIPGMSNARGITGNDIRDIYVVGDQFVARKHLLTWFTDTLNIGSDTLNGVWAPTSDNVWVCGSNGRIVHFDNQWLNSTSGTTSKLNSITGTSNTDLYCVGANSTALHNDGIHWTVDTQGPTIEWRDVHCSDGEICCVGANSMVTKRSHPSTTTFIGTVVLPGWVGNGSPVCEWTFNSGPRQTTSMERKSGSGIYVGQFNAMISVKTSGTITVYPHGYKPQTISVVSNYATVTGTFDGPNHQGLIGGDVNGDGIIDDTDLLDVINHFLSTTYSTADINGDGIVDDTDLLMIINNFLS